MIAHRRQFQRCPNTAYDIRRAHGAISLNAKLMFASSELVDHVLLHELCHTIHAHHGDAFQTLIATLIPNHRQQRAALREAWTTLPNRAHR